MTRPAAIRSVIAFVGALWRFTAASISDLHPVINIDVVGCPAFAVDQRAFAGHLLPVSCDGACQGVRLTRRALERRLKGPFAKAESGGRIAAHRIEFAVGRGVEGFDILPAL